MRRAIDASVRRIDSTARLIDASERFARRRPLRASDGLVLASIWLSHAAAHLRRAMRDLQDPAIYAAPAQLVRSVESGAVPIDFDRLFPAPTVTPSRNVRRTLLVRPRHRQNRACRCRAPPSFGLHAPLPLTE